MAKGRMMGATISKRRLSLSMSPHVLLVMPLLLILLNGCSSGLKLTSDWQQGEINIDGSDSEWQRGLYYDKESDFVYGVRNDDKYVYIFLKTQNRFTQMQIMGQGLTVWFDREGGKNQALGVHYPISRQETHAGFSPDSNEEKLHTFLDQAFPELEIIGPRKEDIQRFSALEAPGIRVKLSRTRETLVYELRVPLKKTSEHPFAIEPISGSRIGIEFETGEFKPEQSKGGMRLGSGHDRGEKIGEDNATEGGGVGGKRFRGGGDQGGRFGKIEKTKQMELWLSVQLAQSTS
ncbi:MAG: hypothetical protein ABR936_00505 [Bacteroidota bacterium]|jgi:hypothetical protein